MSADTPSGACLAFAHFRRINALLAAVHDASGVARSLRYDIAQAMARTPLPATDPEFVTVSADLFMGLYHFVAGVAATRHAGKSELADDAGELIDGLHMTALHVATEGVAG